MLALDGDVAVDPDLLTGAARHASSCLDLPLAERLARASRSAGGGYRATLVLGYVLSQQRRGTEALEALAAAQELATSDTERALAAARPPSSGASTDPPTPKT